MIFRFDRETWREILIGLAIFLDWLLATLLVICLVVMFVATFAAIWSDTSWWSRIAFSAFLMLFPIIGAGLAVSEIELKVEEEFRALVGRKD